jgi:hypothetical protein
MSPRTVEGRVVGTSPHGLARGVWVLTASSLLFVEARACSVPPPDFGARVTTEPVVIGLSVLSGPPGQSRKVIHGHTKKWR